MLVLRPGLLYAIKHTLRLTPSGLLWLGIPCSMLVFISLGTSKRGVGEWDELGDTSLPSVQRSNLHLSRASLLALLAMSRCAWWCCEQPSTSRLPQLRYYADLLNDDNITTSFIRLPGSKILVCDSSRICPWFHFVFGCILFAELDGAVFPLDSEAINVIWNMVGPSESEILPAALLVSCLLGLIIHFVKNTMHWPLCQETHRPLQKQDDKGSARVHQREAGKKKDWSCQKIRWVSVAGQIW